MSKTAPTRASLFIFTTEQKRDSYEEEWTKVIQKTVDVTWGNEKEFETFIKTFPSEKLIRGKVRDTQFATANLYIYDIQGTNYEKIQEMLQSYFLSDTPTLTTWKGPIFSARKDKNEDENGFDGFFVYKVPKTLKEATFTLELIMTQQTQSMEYMNYIMRFHKHLQTNLVIHFFLGITELII
jgi:hypothetical protein